MLTKMTRLTCAFCFLAGTLVLAVCEDGLDKRLHKIEHRLDEAQIYTSHFDQLEYALPERLLRPAPLKKHTSPKRIASR